MSDVERMAQDPDAAPRRRLGRFQLVGELARGGMGIVHEAVDPHLGRRVAIKELLDAEDAGPEAVMRFKREAAVTARLAHPNIVRIHEVGVDGDALFLVMELVEGQPFSRAYPQMSRVERIEALHAVADAVGCAHAQGIVHRDLKPANVLLDAGGRVRVTDFGLAQWRDAPGGLTRTGAMLGTPHYMAPEQIAPRPEVPIDARADVWALGVMLYELLCDRRPYEGDSVAALVEGVGEAPPPLPRSVPRDLAAVCRKALSPTPAARHAGADAFALDLERWLTGRPVSASSSLATRLRHELGRHQRRAALGLILVLAVAVPLGLRWHASRRFARHRAHAVAAAERGDWSAALVAAEQALALRQTPALQALLARCTHALERPRAAAARVDPPPADGRLARLQRLIDQTRPLGYLPSADVPARLAQVAAQLEQLQGTFADAPSARGWSLLGTGWAVLGRLPRAQQALERALALAPDDPTLRTQLGRVMVRLATMRLFGSGYRERSRERLAPTFARAAKLLAVDDPTWSPGPLEAHQIRCYRALAADRPAEVARLARTGIADFADVPGSETFHLLLAAVELDPRKGLASLETALQIRPHDDWALYLRGATLSQQGRHQDALESLDRALQLNPELAEAWNSRGACHLALGQIDRAAADLERTLALDPRMGMAYSNRAGVWIQRGQLAKALADLTRAIELEPRTVVAWVNRGKLHHRMGNHALALADLARAESLVPNKASIFVARGSVYLSQEKHREALQQFAKAILLDPRVTLAHRGCGLALRALGDPVKALRAFDAGIRSAPRDPEGYVLRASLRATQRDTAGAIADLTTALKLNPQHARPWLMRAQLHAQRGAFGDALSDLEALIARAPRTADAYGMRGELRRRQGQHEAAARDFRWALRLRPDHAPTHCLLANVLHHMKDTAGALRHLDRALALDANQVKALALRGILHRGAGDLESALTDHRELTRRASRWWQSWYHHGATLWTMGRADEARRSWARARTVAPPAQQATLEQLIRQTSGG